MNPVEVQERLGKYRTDLDGEIAVVASTPTERHVKVGRPNRLVMTAWAGRADSVTNHHQCRSTICVVINFNTVHLLQSKASNYTHYGSLPGCTEGFSCCNTAPGSK